MGHIFVEGDNLYKSLNTLDMLSVDEQPASVKMHGHDILVQYVKLESKSATITTGDSFLRDNLA